MITRALLLCSLLCLSRFATAAPLPGTSPLAMEGDFSAQMVAGIDRFLLGQTAASVPNRAKKWQRVLSSPAAYDRSVETNRASLRRIIGAEEARLSFEAIEILSSSQNSSVVAENDAMIVRAIRWPVLEGVEGEGLWLRPKNPNGAWVIAVPDADQTPEMLCGLELGLDRDSQFARRLAEAGCEVFVPALISRSDAHSGNAELNRFTNQPHREWIYRQAYELGGHIVGCEVQKVLALVDWLATRGEKKVGVAGYGEGGLLALYAAALDTRIGAALVSGYFGPRESLWREPIYRNLFGLLEEFGDAEIASLIAPRALIVEHCEAPQIKGPPAPRSGRNGAAPGEIWTPDRADAEAELARARAFFPETFRTHFQITQGGPGTQFSLQSLMNALDAKGEIPATSPGLKEQRTAFDPQARERRQFQQLVDYWQGRLERSERVRNGVFWNRIGKSTPEEWQAKRKAFQTQMWDEVIGRLPKPQKEMNPRARQILETEKWRAYDVVLDVWPEVYAWGVLLVPKDLREGERRPVVVCQHGLEGVPRDTIDGPENNGHQYYKSFTARLADRGFITFAPHNPYRGQDKFRVLQRKANPLGKSLFSIILGQHEQILNWLETLPFVDARRIGFYGLSYGGKTAMRVPSLLDRYVLSICSADFNEWVKKNATIHSPYSYMFSGEYEMPEFNLGRTFNYAEMAALIAPRPFMVERGHDDGVAPDEWVAYEFAKVKRFYDKLGIGDRTELEVFNGPHTINGVDTYKFLHRHLAWPEPKTP